MMGRRIADVSRSKQVRLGIESLESRIVMSNDPIVTLPTPQDSQPAASEPALTTSAPLLTLEEWVHSLQYYEFSQLAASEIVYLTPQQVSTIPNSEMFRTIAPAARAALGVSQVQSLNVDRISISLLTAEQIKWLTAGQIRSLRHFDFAHLSPGQIPLLTTAQLASISDSATLPTWSVASRAALTSQQIQAINVAKTGISGFTAQQVSWLTREQVQQLKHWEFARLTVGQIPWLTPSQVASIPNGAGFAQLSSAARGAMTQVQIQALSVRRLGISLLTPQQISWLQNSQIQSLQFWDFKYLQPFQIPTLTTLQIASIPNTSILPSWSAASRAAMTAPQVQSLNVERIGIQHLPAQQVRWLTQAQVQLVEYWEFPLLSPGQVPWLTAAQIASIPSPEALGALSLQARAALTANQVGALRVDKTGIALLPSTQIGWLSVNQLRQLRHWEFQLLNPIQIPQLTAAQIASIPNRDALASWTEGAAASLTTNQVRSLNVAQTGILALTPQQVAWLTVPQIQSLSLWEITALAPAQIPHLLPAQFSTADSADVLNSLSDAAEAALTRDQLLALPPDAWARFSRLSYAHTPPSNYVPVVEVELGPDGLPMNPHMDAEAAKVMNLVPLASVTHATIRSGPWSSPATWRNGVVPTAGAKVLISQGTTAYFDAYMTFAIDTLRIDGALNFATDLNTQLKADTIVVNTMGALRIGTEQQPIADHVTATILIADGGPIDSTADPYLLSRGVLSRGEIRMHGKTVTPYVNLAVAPSSGDTRLYLAQAPTNWKIGDELVIAGTQHTEDFGTDRVRIRAINGATVTVDPLKYDHVAPAGYGLTIQVANLNRNVVLRAEDPSVIAERPHMILMHNPNVKIDNISVAGFGRTDKTKPANDPVVVNGSVAPGTGLNTRARYAIHFHHTGVNPLVQPATVSGSVVIDSPGWGYVNHSSNVVMEDNVAFEVVGSSFVAEDGNEIGAMRRNLSINSRGAGWFDVARHENHDFGFLGHGFWFQGPGVEVTDNIAAGSRTAGFTYMTLSSKSQFDAVNLSDPSLAGGQVAVPVGSVPLNRFARNTAYATATGFDLWYNMRLMTDGETVIDDFTAWNTNFRGIELHYSGHVTIQDALLIGNLDDYGGTGISTNQWVHDVAINNSRILGYGVGIDVPVRRSTIINGGRIAALNGIFIEKGHDALRSVDIIGSLTFDTPTAIQLAGRPHYRVYLTGQYNVDEFKDRHTDSLFSEDRIRLATTGLPPVILQYYEQYAYYTPFPSAGAQELVPDEFYGITNAQIQQRYGVTYAGSISPVNARMLPGIHAFVIPGV